MNHPNQFIDSFLIAVNSPHHVRFLISAASYKQGAIGFFSKAFNSIPVERPRDIAVNGIGRIELLSNQSVIGVDSQFYKQARVGDTLLLKSFLEYTIVEIKSDTEMTIKSKTRDTRELNGLMDYKIASKINQSSIFENAVNWLKEERWLVIFPEGCSHEYTDLIPLKAGASVIGLETMTKYKDTDVNFVCWGLK